MSRLLAIASLAFWLPLEALAEQMTVDDLQQICAGSQADTANACRFYILGVVEGSVFGNGAKAAAGPLCIAPDVPGSALVVAVKQAMKADLLAFPQDKSLAAAGFVVAAAMKSFPCKK